MARSRTDAAGRRLRSVGLPGRVLPATALLAAVLLAAVLLAGGRGDGAAADPGPLEPIAATGVAPGSGTLMPEGHRETDTDLDTWVAPDATSGVWYAFPLPSGFEAVEPAEGTELLVRSLRGQARTVLSVTRLPQEGRLGL
ncbi:MAG TPA: hypothetical protein VMM13_20485, partial [Euzebya sp.]|nr:hypothetical protein [Euzebya sp.]